MYDIIKNIIDKRILEKEFPHIATVGEARKAFNGDETVFRAEMLALLKAGRISFYPMINGNAIVLTDENNN